MLNPIEMQRYIAATAARADLNVVWEAHGSVPRTNSTTIFLPSMPAEITPEEYKSLQHSVGHEVRHQLYSDLVSHSYIDTQNSLLGMLWNAIEDTRVDYLDSSKYEGDRQISNDVHHKDRDHILTLMKERGVITDDIGSDILPILGFTEDNYKDFYHSAHLGRDALLEAAKLNTKADERLTKLLSSDYGDVLRNIRTIEDKTEGTGATLKLAERIFNEVYGGDAEKEKEKMKQAAKAKAGEGKADKGEKKEAGEGEGKDEGEGGAEAEAGDGETDKKGKPADPKEGPVVTVKWRPGMEDLQNATSMRGMHLDYSTHKDDPNYIPCDAKGYEVVTAASDVVSEKHAPTEKELSRRISTTLVGTSSGFAHKVRTVLQVRARDHYQYGLKKGKLNDSSLYRVTMKEARGFNERIFKRKIDNNILDAAVSILVDTSGSMCGSKYANAAVAGLLFNETIGNTLHIPTEIVGFTTPSGGHFAGKAYADHYGCRIYIHREHKDKRVAKDVLLNSFAKAGCHMAGNPDGDAITWVFDRLVRRPEKRKLLIVCSDGSPSGGGRGDEVWYTKKVVGEIERDSPVDIVGIGIMDDNVKRFYKEHYIITQASGLEHALLAVIENKLK